MRLLLDMGLPRRTAEDLSGDGWDVTHIAALGRPTATDEEIVELARIEGRAIVTLDSDFTRILALAGTLAPSLIHLRIDVLDRVRATALLRTIVPGLATALSLGCIVSVTGGGIRLRRLPIG